MAGVQYLNRLAVQVHDRAVETLQALLPDDGDGKREREALEATHRDVVARNDQQFRTTGLVAALTSVVAKQQEEIATLKRTKANAAALKEK